MSITKKAKQNTNLASSQKTARKSLSREELAKREGFGCKKFIEPQPIFLQAECEKVFSGEHNTYIILGRDRPKGLLSGYGGRADTGAGSIDIVVGRDNHNLETVLKKGSVEKEKKVNPDFFVDAARIYIAQKTNIDENFKIGKKGNLEERGVKNSIARSAIGLKADAIRIVGREGVKIVTRTDVKNSHGQKIHRIQGIDLIAGNDEEDLQPLVKGQNLTHALSTIVYNIDKLNGLVDAFLSYQLKLNKALASHQHYSPFFGLLTTPSETVLTEGIKTMLEMVNKAKMGLAKNKINLANLETNYLVPGGSSYINSRYNTTN